MYVFLITLLSNFLLFNLQHNKVQSTIDQIYEYLQKEQAKENIPFRFLPQRWEEDKGLYRSFIHVNWVDESNSYLNTLIRNNLKVGDTNNFVTSFVLMNLLESYEISGRFIDEMSLKNGLDSLLQFKDKNYGSKTPIYTFWKQNYQKEKNLWVQYTSNMKHVIDSLPPFSNRLIYWLELLKLEKLKNFLLTYNSLRGSFLNAYRIPSDNDDTFVNLALTSRLNKFDSLRNISENWTNENTNYTELFHTVKKYAYRPFLNFSKREGDISKTADVIDTRSYFVMHGFITEQAEKFKALNKTPELILPTTWLSDIEKQKNSSPYISMPFNVNNVDHNVAINFLFGLTNFVLFHKNSTERDILFDEEMQQMYSNTVDLIIYAIRNNTINKRPDLTLVYYPSVYDFYWLVSRVYSLINTNINSTNSNFLNEIQEKMKLILTKEATSQLCSKVVKHDEENSYFEEFLGNAGNYSRGEDRLFSTGLAFNSLLNIWTSKHKSNSSFYYEKDTPEEVKDIIKKSANYIMNNINKYFTSLENSFFSGSVKNQDTMPYFYPGNYFKFMNGSDITDPSNYLNFGDFISVIPGTKVIEPNEFIKNLNQTFCSRKPPQDFIGYNAGTFPYWSSPAMTYSVNLLGLIKFKNLIK